MAGEDADITERLQSLFVAKVFGKPLDEDEAASLAYEARHEIMQLREALMVSLGVGGDADDPMVQDQIQCAKNVAALTATHREE